MGTTFKVNVKWTKQLFKDVELDTSEPPSVFQTQLWTLTGVPPERQTVLLKGGKLKESTDWSKAGLRQNMTIMMMGTVDSNRLPPPPTKSLVRDDLDADANDVEMNYEPHVMHPPGLINKGNTCYMNATVQCLNVVKPLSDTLVEYRGRTDALGHDEKLSASFRDLVSRLRSGNAPKIDPSGFLNTLRQVNPQFAEVGGPHRMYMQQDAEECFGEILTRLASALKTEASDGEGSSNKIDELFAIETKSVDTCEEDESEPPIERIENIRMLKCHISKDVNHLNQGIKEGLEDTLEKHSEKLGRTAKWKRSSKLQKIPPYLIVQFVRFFWKSTEQVKAKILRNVSFPIELDVYDFCTDELKQQLSEKRTKVSALSGENSASDSSYATAAAVAASPAPAPAGDEVTVRTETSTDVAKTGTSVMPEIGNYELCAVLTHKGRAADSGHYVAWVKDEGNRWYKFDDDVVTVQTEEDVKKLYGGGDWHMSYMCMYRAKNSF